MGDGQTRRRGSDAIRLGLAGVVLLVCWLATKANTNLEHSIATTLGSPPNGIRWLISTMWWITSLGVIAVIAGMTLMSRRLSAIRDIAVSGVAAWLICVLCGVVLGTDGGRPSTSSFPNVDLSFPVARVAATVAVVTAALPYFSRWLQLCLETAIGLLAITAVVHGSGLPVSVLASLAVGWGVTAVVHLGFGSPLGLPSTGEVQLLLGDLRIAMADVAPAPKQEWGVGRFEGVVEGAPVDVSVYGRDASDAQLLAKTVRFLFYRDSGPTLALTRRQQVEHEAYLTLMADRAGARVPVVLAAGPAGPARDAVFITRPPPGRPLSAFAPYAVPPAPTEGTTSAEGAVPPAPEGAVPEVPSNAAPGHATAPDGATSPGPTVADHTLDSVFGQLLILRAERLSHGALSTATIVVDDDGSAGFVDFRTASTVASTDQLDRDMAATLAALSVVAGPERTVDAAVRNVPTEAVVGALPYLQRAALDPVAARSLRSKKALLVELREQGARAVGVDVPKLIEPRRISWVNLALVAGTLIGGWALIGVLINVTKSWSTITGAAWGWVAVTFVLAQAAYPAIALTTVGSVTNPLPYGRTLALELSDTFVALAGGSMAVLATRVRFFQQEGYTPTVAVSSGVLVSTASWIVKGALFLIALPLAIGNLHFDTTPSSDSSSSSSHLVWIIVLAVVALGVGLGLVFAVPRWRRLAAAKLRPKASEVWSHLKLLAGHPRNLVEIFGGSAAAQVFVALALGASLHAFGDSLSLATLIVVLTLGSMLGGISPVPGGMGVVEAGMIIGLTAAGINESDAVAAVFVQRLFTAYLPPIWGWFVLVWMRKKEYL
ncbi:MAG TPA: lysylphosphatidylglycerol synthase domain-containing protein [Acidimicrobiales bacterium]|nr:lysylphosphatidylglycerol synthase domain-containing protein [Acidimicrobiales bacterium]